MTCQQVQDVLTKKLHYVVVSKHKTRKAYGDLAKYLPPGAQLLERI